MTYEKNPPDFNIRSKAPGKKDDGFDPSPYDRISRNNPTVEELINLVREPEIPVSVSLPENPKTSITEPAAANPKAQVTGEAGHPGEGGDLENETAEAERPAEATTCAPETIAPKAEAVISESPAPRAEISESPAAKEETPEPEAKAIFAHMPPQQIAKKEPAKIIPPAGAVMCSNLKVTDIKEPPRVRVFIEEDILVPDIKPDLKSILLMDGVAKLSDKEILVGANGEDTLKVVGEIALQTIYVPDKAADDGEPIMTIQSRIPFKSDWGVSVSPLSHVAVKPIIETIDYTIINERKIRAKIAMFLTLREYSDMDIEIFEEIRGEDLQLLKETIRLTDVAVRKNDIIELNDRLLFKDSAHPPEKILKYNINIVENHKHIAGEKAVINAIVYCNVLYITECQDSLAEADENACVTRKKPCVFQGKTEFTQFIPLGGTENPAGSRVAFNGSDLALKIKEEEDGVIGFVLEGSVETSLEIYQNMEKEIVTDLYHNTKDVSCDYSEIVTATICGGGVSEVSVREILNIPAEYGESEEVIYISGKIKDNASVIEQGKNIVSGTAEITLLLISSGGTPGRITQEIPFRGATEIPGIQQGMTADNEIAMKDLWFDKINSKQIEVNAGIFISSAVSCKKTHKLIKNVCFVEKTDNTGRTPGMIVYITRKGDSLWKIAKRYRTTIDAIKAINNLEQSAQVPQGTKLLIVK